jgi:hypothetical protein
MKIVKIIACALLLILPGAGCKKVLDESNRSNIAPDYFKTAGGIDGAVIGMYSNLRNWYGLEPMAYNTMLGTDEHLTGANNSAGPQFQTYTIQTNDANVYTVWEWAYRSINNANGVLEFAPTAGLSAADQTRLVAEAKFMRAYYYFMLVQTFGDVTISTSFVQGASTSATREPISAVYDLIVKDLTEALTDLPNKQTVGPGRAGKAAALFLLSKVYLTRGWSTAAKATDFSDAYAKANELIANKATYGIDLWADYADVYKETNDYNNKEWIFVVDRNIDVKGSESLNIGTGTVGGKYNGANFFQCPNYPTFSVNLNEGITGAPPFLLNGQPTASSVSVDRDMPYSRPFVRIRPSNYTLNTAFADKVNDTRYRNTFQLFYLFNRPGPLAAQTPVNITVHRGQNPNDPNSPLVPYVWRKNVDTALILTGRATASDAERRASKAYLVTTAKYDANFYPAMIKHNDLTRAHVNDASDRPFPLFRFAEIYLIAAEAAFKTNNLTQAKDMINVIRARARALPISESDVTIDFILDERTRELFGEWMRWYDLVRTKTLANRLATYNPIAGFNPSRDYLRPIPQRQIDLVTTGPQYPQNPNY